MKRTIYFAAALLAVAACGNRQTEQAGPAELVTKISTTVAHVQNVPQTETYSSTVQAFAVNNIAPQSGGRIKKINVDVGSFVSKGQVLAEMDNVQLQQQQLQLANAETELARLKQLYDQGGLSQSDYESAELQCKVARASYENLLENTVLRSPINGVVTARNYDAGDMYAMAQPIYTVQQITPVKILVGVSETDYSKVKAGQKVNVQADALPGRVFEGSVRKLYPTMDAASHTFIVEVTVPNSDRALRPGMYTKSTVNFGDNRSIVIPDKAAVKQLGTGRRHVYVLQDDGTVKGVPVKLGRHTGLSYEILEGLEEGDVIAVEGASALKDGAKVEVVKKEE